MSHEYRRLLLESKMIAGGRAAARARIGGALAAQQALPGRRQNPRLMTRLKRADRKLAKRGKGKAAARYNPHTQRPRTLPQARAWAQEKLITARNRHMATMLDGPAAHARNTHLGARAERIHLAAQGVLGRWERTKRPPKGFRRGRG